MARKSRISRLNTTSSKRSNMNPKWLQNAIKSLGGSTKEALSDIYPNISEVTSHGLSTGRNVVNSIRSNRGSIGQVNGALENNKYVQTAKKAFSNAIADLKSGNFNNQDRMMEASMSGFEDFADDMSDIDFSFDDDGSDGNNFVNINYNSDNDTGMVISNAMRSQTETMLKTNKASLDAFITVSSTSIFQVQKIGSEVINQLGNINNSLNAIVQYNNENMTKFIEGSLAYYERMGSAMENESKYGDKSKIKATDIFNNRKGGINISQYKAYIKQEMKKSKVGGVAGLIDDSMLDMLASNPLGFASKAIVAKVIPSIIGSTVETMEKTFSAFVPNLVSQMTEWADDYTGGMLGSIKRNIGKMFGVKVERKGEISATVNKGVIPFDGETKHAITEIITKELREQTSYLRAIAGHYGIDTKKVRANSEVWDYNTNRYIRQGDIERSILETIKDSMVDTFFRDKGSFGDVLQEMVRQAPTEETQKSLQHTMEELIVAMVNSNKHINPLDKNADSAYNQILANLSKNKKNRQNINNIDAYIKEMSRVNPTAFYDLSRSVMNARQAKTDRMNDIENDPTYYNLFASGLNGVNDIDDRVDKAFGYGKYSTSVSTGRRYKRPSVSPVSRDTTGRGVFGQMATATSQSLTRQMQAIMSGNGGQIGNEIGNLVAAQTGIIMKSMKDHFFTPFKSIVFGDKDDKGYSSNGIFSGLNNGFTDFTNNLKHQITGAAYTDSNGQRHDETKNSVKGQLTSMANSIKVGITEKLFGKEETDKDGNPTGKREKSGLFSKFTNSLKSGLEGWRNAFIGDEKSTEKEKEEITTKLKKTMEDSFPSMLTGAVIANGINIMAGSSVLGLMMGGPLMSSALGMVGGFLSRSDKFKNWLFGEEKDGERVGGIISKKSQDFLKKNKNYVIGGTALGAITGALGLKGGGLLGTMVGGPIAGALTGFASSILLRSDTFKNFLFGDEKTGRKGIFKTVKDAFMKHQKSTVQLSEGGKLFGMTAIGAASGALSASIIGKMGILGAALTPMGPIGGAIAGLGLSIAAQGKNFKKWLFGETVEENGKKVRKHGIIGQFGNALNSNVFRPLIHEGQYIVKDIGNSFKHQVLAPISWVAEDVAERVGMGFNAINERVTNMFSKVGDKVHEKFSDILTATFKPLGKMTEVATHLVYKSVKSATLLPFNIMKVGMTLVHNKVIDWFKPAMVFLGNVRKRVFHFLGRLGKHIMNGVNGVLKPILAVPKFLLGLGGAAFNSVKSRVSSFAEKRKINLNWGSQSDENLSLTDRIRRDKKEAKADKARLNADRKLWKEHDKNAKLISKYTKNQYSSDTTEAREALKRANYNQWLRLNRSIDSEDEARRKAEAETKQNKEQLSATQLAKADPSKLSYEGRQTFYLQGIFNMMRGKTWNGEENEETKNSKIETAEELSARIQKEIAKQKAIEEEARKEAGEDEASIEEAKKGLDGRGVRSYLKQTKEDLKSYFFGSKQTGKKSLIGRVSGYFDKNDQENEEFNEKLNTRMSSAINEWKDRRYNNSVNRKMKRDAKRLAKESINGGNGIGVSKLRRMGGFGPDVAGLIGSGSLLPVYIADMSSKVANDISPELSSTEMTILKDRQNDLKNAEERAKRSREAMERAREAGTSAEEKRKMIEEEEARENLTRISQNTESQVEETKKHSSMWSSIFSKKGLITGGLLLLSPILLKLGKWLLGKGGSLLGDIVGGIGTTVSDTIKSLIWGNQQDARTNGKSAGEVIHDEIANTQSAIGKAAHGNLIGAASTFITNSDGELDHESYSKTKLLGNSVNIGRKIMKKPKVQKGISKVKPIAGKLASGAYNFATGNLGATSTSKVGKKLGKVSDKIVTKAKGGISGLTTKASEGITKVAKTANEKIISKVISAVEGFFSKVIAKVSAKTGSKLSTSAFSSLIRGVKDGITKCGAKIVEKAGPFLTGTAALASTVVGLAAKEITWVALGTINGATGAARLFQVDSEYVDAKMILISTAIGAFEGTTVGTLVDIVNEVLSSVTTVDFVSQFACLIYRCLSGEEKEAKLDQGRAEFKEKYETYKNDTLEKQYNDAIKKGNLDSSVSFEAYKTGVSDGTYKAKYKSFADYNADQHKNLGAKIISGVKGIGRGISNGFKSAVGWVNRKAEAVGNFLKSHKEKAWYESNGSYYMISGDGFKYCNANGDVISDSVTKEEVQSMIESGVLTEGEITVASGIKKGLNSIKNSVTSVFSSAANKCSSVFTTVKKGVLGLFDKITGNEEKGMKKPGRARTIKVWFDTYGNYYKENGGKYDYFNVNNDLVTSGVDAETVEAQIKSGMLVSGEIQEDSAAKNALSKIHESIRGAWDTAKSVVTNGWESFKNWITGGTKTEYVQPTKPSNTNVRDKSKFRQDVRAKRQLGGGHGDEMNGFKYYSQNDSRWGSSAYNEGQDNATMSTSGCGPTAMAMVTSQMTGMNVNPRDMAKLAKATGNRDNTGTNWNFINQASSIYGLNSTQQYNPSASYIDSELSQGNPVILSGSSNSGGFGATPYTPAGHYVVAVGKDNNGNAIINDPRGKQYSKKYKISDIAKQTGSAWSFGKGGFGISNQHSLLVDRGTTTSSGTASSPGKMNWDSTVKTVKAAIAAQNPVYNQGGYIYIKINNVTEKVRTDCSGYVSACLVYYGAFKSGEITNSTGFSSSSDIENKLTNAGFKKRRFTGWSDLRCGDIISQSGSHVEIFAYTIRGHNYVYSCGSTNTLRSAGPTLDSGKHVYDTVWSPPENAVGTIGSYSSDGIPATTDGVTTPSSGTSFFDKLGGFFSEAGSRMLNGVFTGNFNSDFSSYWNGNTGSTDSSTSSTPMATNVNPSDVSKSTWDYFTSNGYSKQAVAGILGNLQQESGMNPSAIQPSQHAAGIAQWESYKNRSGRWKAMADYAASKGKSWTDLGSQLEFIDKELRGLGPFWRNATGMSRAGTYPTDYNSWKNSNNIDEATRQFEGAFERAGKPMMQNRIAAANKFYSIYAGGGNGEGTMKLNSRNIRIPMSEVPKSTSGGFGVNKGSTQRGVYIDAESFKKQTRNITKKHGEGSIEVLLNSINEFLSQISTNTASVDGKLDFLKSLSSGNQNKSVNTTTNNIIASNSTPVSQTSNVKTPSESRNSILAKKLALGL